MRIHNGKIKRSCSLVLILALCVSLFAGCSTSGIQSSENVSKAGTLLTTIYEDVLYLADPDGNVHTANFYGEVYSEQTSMDGSKYIAVDDDDYTLLYFNGEKILTLANNVAVAAMSVDGNSVAYITVTEEENNTSELRLYSEGEEKVIAVDTIVMCAVSPDGSAVGYTTADEDGNYRTYYWNGTDDIHEVGKYRPIIAISNGGEYVYYAQLDDNGRTDGYYVQHGDDSASKVKMADTFSEGAIHFNYDGSELLFSDGENMYIFAKGEKRFEVPNGDLSPQFPESVIQCRSDYIGGGIITYSAASFADHYFLLGNKNDPDFVYIDQDYNAVTIVKHGREEKIYICADGKTAYFYVKLGKEYEYYEQSDPEYANSLAEEFYGYGIGTYRVHSDKLEEGPVFLYEQPWYTISENENIHYFENIQIVQDEETKEYHRTYTFCQVDISKRNPEPVAIKTVVDPDDYINYAVLVYNAGSDAIPENAKICAELNGKVIYMVNEVYYCYDGKEIQPVNGLQNWNGPLMAYENVFIAFTSWEQQNQFLYVYDNSILTSCYFSIDGINFMPLVKSYIAEKD